ncbi:MAG: helix-turn-helix transcriptional regulator [Clostridia bacterium]|nr:helix-turn-helix transcriptional regulator [Clostridia bacterium]
MITGELIKALRKERGLTQIELAKAAHISRSYLGDIERDRYDPSLKTLRQISAALQVTPGSLLEGEITRRSESHGS